MREDCCLNGAGPFLLNAFKFSMLHISLSGVPAVFEAFMKEKSGMLLDATYLCLDADGSNSIDQDEEYWRNILQHILTSAALPHKGPSISARGLRFCQLRFDPFWGFHTCPPSYMCSF